MAHERFHVSRWLALVACLGMGCQGAIEAPEANPHVTAPPPPVCDRAAPPDPGRAPLRRLTVEEYDNTIADLLGVTTAPASRLIDPERGVAAADSRHLTPLLAEQYMNAAEEVSGTLIASDAALEATTGCGEDAHDAACVRAWIERLLPRAFRRPVEADEVERLAMLFEAVEADDGFGPAVGVVVQAILQSPSFLYRVEVVDPSREPVVRLDGYAIANRLSYFLTSSMPDEALFAAAEAGELDTSAGVEEHARRLLERPESEATVQRFFAGYLEIDTLGDVEKDPAAYPEFTPTIASLMRTEVEAFIHEVVVEGSGSWRELLTADYSMMNRELADYYGVDGPSGEEFERVPLDARHHAGLLTQGGLMATRARAYETSPIHRGMFVRGTLLCGHVPDVPEGLDITPIPPDPSLTTRERLAQHREDPYCRSCHEQIDPLGFAFEHFDGAGRFRAEENDLPIDASGELLSTDRDGHFDGAPSLAARIVDSEQAQACFTERWFVTAIGRAESRNDACSLDNVRERFVESGYDVRELIVAFTLSDAFLYRAAVQPGDATEESE
ncbi:MAG: DUF1592 domain-containing protein [Sandaracinaceae bacterium]